MQLNERGIYIRSMNKLHPLPSLNSTNTKSSWNKGTYLCSSTECSKTANTTEKYWLSPTSSKFFRWNLCLSYQVPGSQNSLAGIYQYHSKFTNISTTRSTTRVLIVTVVGAADDY